MRLNVHSYVILSLFLLLILVGCSGSGPGESGSIAWPQYSDTVSPQALSITDPASDLVLAPGGAPQVVIPYPPVDLIGVKLWVANGYFYIRADFSGALPTAPQVVADQTVTQQGFNVSLDTDNNPATGASVQGIGGIDIFFAFLVPYGGSAIVPYANYNFSTTDIHSSSGHLEGELRGGGPGYAFATYRFSLAQLGTNFPSGNTAMIGGWSEAESSLYHHFAYDPFTAVQWGLP